MLALATSFAASTCCLPWSETPCNAECAGYPCDAAGARRMLDDEVTRRANRAGRGETPWSGDALKELDALFDAAVTAMEREGFTPASFTRARDNLRKFLDQLPPGLEESAAREVERVRRRSHWLCPLWPFC